MHITRFGTPVLVIGLLLTAACGGGRKAPEVTPGTGPVGLPPVPADIASRVYVADAYLGVGCAAVPSGLNNCQVWLRENADARMVSLLEHEVSESVSATGQPVVEGTEDSGGFSERSAIDRIVVREALLTLSLRTLESPILALEDGRNYALRVLVIREEADHRILTAMADRAEELGDENRARRYRDQIRRRYGDKGPNASTIEEVDRRAADYFGDLWEMTQKRPEKKK